MSGGQGTTACSDSQKCAAGLDRCVRCLTKAFTESVKAVASAMTGTSRLHLWGTSAATSIPTGWKRLTMSVLELRWSRSRRFSRVRCPTASWRIRLLTESGTERESGGGAHELRFPKAEDGFASLGNGRRGAGFDALRLRAVRSRGEKRHQDEPACVRSHGSAIPHELPS